MQVVLLVPAALILTLFGDAVLRIWSGNEEIVRNVDPILSILTIGTCLNGFMHMPYLAQLAHGWTSLAFYQSLVSVISAYTLDGDSHAGLSGSWGRVCMGHTQRGYVLIAIHIMHRRILRARKMGVVHT